MTTDEVFSVLSAILVGTAAAYFVAASIMTLVLFIASVEPRKKKGK